MTLETFPENILAEWPEHRRSWLGEHWASLTSRLAAGETLPETGQFMGSAARVWISSDFVLRHCLKSPEMLSGLCRTGDLFNDYAAGDYASRCQLSLDVDREAFSRAIRRFRNREMVRIAWRDIAGWSDIEQILRELSWLAEQCIQIALAYATGQVSERCGIPLDEQGNPMQLAVLGMGKLGGWELNFSSDVDLIFAYAGDGVLPDRKQTGFQQFFIKVAQLLISTLEQVTEDGFVFRVDTRLRPFGSTGPLAMSMEAMESYYQRQAREWERYAMIKCRPVAGDLVLGQQIVDMLRPFVYRAYLDYGALDELRDLKAQITQQLERQNRGNSIKLGHGGIREVEFIGQVFQLIHGGRNPSLRGTRLVPLLEKLCDQELLEKPLGQRLVECYRQFRRVENRIQQRGDQQCHEMPEDPEKQEKLVAGMGFSDWNSLQQSLNDQRAFVHEIFEQVFALEKEEKFGAVEWAWLSEEPDDRACMLAETGFEPADEAARYLESFRNCAAVRRLSKRSRVRLDKLMPRLLEQMVNKDEPSVTLQRLLMVLEAIVNRGVYLALLLENKAACLHLIHLVEASPWIAASIARTPLLLDELLDPRTLYTPLRRDQLDEQIQRDFTMVPEDDLEAQMNALRRFKLTHVLHVAAADIAQVIPIMVVSDYLTEIAEVTLQQALRLAWQQTGQRYGFPAGCDAHCIEGFAVIAYGKLGGKELGYASDLDLVFLHQTLGENLTGAQREQAAYFYARLGQKLVAMLNTRMLSGVAYEIDTRLRPSGQSGLLVSPLDAYAAYLREQAWLWEHQALVKARFVAGDNCLGQQFSAIRREILVQPRERDSLRREVRDMRQRMREALDRGPADCFDLKHSEGGIADIEFIVQFEVLLHAHEMPELAGSTDVVRLLARLEAAELLTSATVDMLRQAYCCYRDHGHRSALQDTPNVIRDDRFDTHRLRVRKLWQTIMERQ